jgi:hypothetical protein
MCVDPHREGEVMRVAVFLLGVLGVPALVFASGHGPLFGLATPTNSQGEWSFDEGIFGRAANDGEQVSARTLIGYGFTPHLSLFVTIPVIAASATLPPTRIQPGGDFDSTLAWRFQHRATKVGTRIESTAFASFAVPGQQSGFKGIANTSNAPGRMLGAVTGTASRSNYLWLGATYTKFFEHNSDRRPGVLSYSLVYGYRPPKWRKPPDKWDWRLFAELVGECSQDFLQANSLVVGTQANQLFLGPSALGIYRNYTVSFGAQLPVYQDVGSQFPKERVRFAVNLSYLLFQHSH